MKINNSLFISIKGVKLSFYLMDNDKYVSEHGDDSKAITDPDEKTVHFNLDDFTYEIVLHELGHLYFTYYVVDNVNYDQLQTEEAFCTMLMQCYGEIGINASKIYKYYKNYIAKRKSK